MSAIKEAYIMFNGRKVIAQYDEGTKTWTATTNAPANSSWSQPDHVYKVEIHAVDAANNEATMTSADSTYGDQLKIRVLEKSKPTATIVSPTQGSVLGASEQDIVLEMSDAGGSGLNETTVVFTVNGESHAGDLSFTDHESKRRATYHATGLNDGQNTITFQVTDNDGNVSELATRTSRYRDMGGKRSWRQRSYSVSGADSIFREIGYSRSNRSLPISYSTFCRKIPRGIADEISEF